MVVEPRPASTVVLMDNKSRVYLTKRPSTMKFYGDHYVFPGGSVDKRDYDFDNQYYISTHRNESSELAYYIAATRELFEEVGILLVKDCFNLQKSKQHQYRQLLIEEKISLLEMLKRERLTINLDNLAYFANRTTSKKKPIRFETRFFIANLPPNQIPNPDPNEIADAIWLTPQESLEANQKGEILLPRPTKMALKTIINIQSGGNLTMDDFYKLEEKTT